jgi:hypothetical protein
MALQKEQTGPPKRRRSVAQDESAVTIGIEDKATIGGTAHLELIFDPATFALKQWTVIGGYGDSLLNPHVLRLRSCGFVRSRRRSRRASRSRKAQRPSGQPSPAEIGN